MRIQRTAVIAQVGIHYGKVEIDDKILVVVGRRFFAYIEVAIESLELIGSIDVVIMVQHRHSKALAETSWADEEEELVGSFHFLDKPCLIDIIAIVFAYSHEVHHAVRYALCLFLCNRLLFRLIAVFNLQKAKVIKNAGYEM